MSWHPPPPPPRSGTAKPSVNYYELLQVDPKADPTIIRYAYRYLAAMYHPDNSESGNEDKFKTITNAWQVLSDSGKRQAYDVQLGVKSQASSVENDTKSSVLNPPSLTWSEVELRLAVLQVLMEARRKRPQTGGASARMLMDCLNCQMGDIEYVLWYLREKSYVTRTESAFMISVQGVDYLVDQLSQTQPINPRQEKLPIKNLKLPDSHTLK